MLMVLHPLLENLVPEHVDGTPVVLENWFPKHGDGALLVVGEPMITERVVGALPVVQRV